MFCYQPEKSYPSCVIPGVYNSKTELMTKDRFNQLVCSPQTQWLVKKHRQVKASLNDKGWLLDPDFQEFDRRMRAKPNSRAGKAYIALKDDQKRMAAWCQDLKQRLPFAIFIGTYPERVCKEGGERARWRNQKFIELNGLVVLDFDHLDGDVRKLWDESYGKLSDEEKQRILFVFVSPGGQGLKVIFKADPATGNLIDNQIVFGHKLGLEVDESCKDAARGTFLTTKDDIIYINEKELFDYENKEFGEKYNDQYHRGNSQPTIDVDSYRDVRGTVAAGADNDVAGAPAATAEQAADDAAQAAQLSYHGVEYTKIVEAWLDGKEPGAGDRHATALRLACDLRYITDNDAKLMEQILRSLPWVKAIIDERGEDVALLVKSAREYKMLPSMPRRLSNALKNLTGGQSTCEVRDEKSTVGSVPLCNWGERIEGMFGDFPCLKEVCGQLSPECWPAAMFTAAAFMGTLMTRTWYYFYHRPEEKRRLNYCIMVIGDPASGKSFATRLYKLLAAPIKSADKVGYDAINRYKRERQERTTSTKAQKGEALKKPEVIIRDHPARTSNATFIDDMNKAVEIIDGEPMHLHMLTFDSELDNATLTQRGGSWIDKSAMELKAFHNEEDGQAYSNLESVSGTFNVYWNFVYTGTPLSLQRKVSERNFGSGLATRLAVIPLPPSGFQMMELRRTTRTDQVADETLKTWAFKLDKVQGELPLWPLVEHCWEWTKEHMEIAAFNDDHADELLMKRVPYYGICISTPFILMRHWEEWQSKKTFDIDDKDKELCTLALDIQYYCQHRFFGKMAEMYFDNKERDEADNRRCSTRFNLCYQQLPETFNLEDVEKVFKVSRSAARAYCSRMKKTGSIDALNQGQFKKLKKSLV